MSIEDSVIAALRSAFDEVAVDLEQQVDSAIEEHRCDALLQFVRQCTELQAMLGAIEMRAVAGYDALVRAKQWRAELPARHIGRGIAQDIGKARRISPSRASKHAAAATIAVRDLPQTMAQLRAGNVNTENVEVIAAQVSVLSRDHRLHVDAKLAPKCGNLSRRQAEGMARALADTLDQEAAVARRERSIKQRRVTVRPAPDDMAYLTALLPMTQAIACKAALMTTAQTLAATGAGDSVGRPANHPADAPRTTNHLEADLLIELLTGQSAVAVTPTQVNLLVPAETLAGGAESAIVSTGGTGVGSVGPVIIPAAEARGRVLAAHDHGVGSLRVVNVDEAGKPQTLSRQQPLPHDLVASLRETVEADQQWAVDRQTLRDTIQTEVSAIACLTGGAERHRAIDHLCQALAPPLSHQGHETFLAELTALLREAVLLARDPQTTPEHRTSAHHRVLRHVESVRQSSLHVGVLNSIRQLRTRTGAHQHTLSENRFARGLVRELVELRDQTCRTPYCDAPIRDVDHIIPVHAGGTTTPSNLQGLCQSCNLAKEIPRHVHS